MLAEPFNHAFKGGSRGGVQLLIMCSKEEVEERWGQKCFVFNNN